MAKKFSTGLRNAILGAAVSVTGLTLSSAETGKKILDSANGLAIFMPGDIITVSAALIAAGYGTVVTVIADGSYLTVSETPLTQAAGASYTVALANKRSFKEIFQNGILEIYSGSQPADADTAEAGTKLARISVSAGAVVPGVATNGLNFGAPAAGVIAKAGGETWSGVGVADGVAGWFRFYTNLYHTGAGTSKVRFDGSVGIAGSNAQLIVANTTIAVDSPITVSTFTVTLAA